MIRCLQCFTSFEESDFIEHKLAHARLSLTPKQSLYNVAQATQKTTRHAPNAECNCAFYGVRNYCEVLKREAA